jgi:hypothetical protein
MQQIEDEEPPLVQVEVPTVLLGAGGEQANNNNAANAEEVDLNDSNEPVVQAVPASNPT